MPMKTLRFVYLFLIILLLAGCSKPAESLMQPYEHALIEADSLARSGAADSASAVRLIAHLHTEDEDCRGRPARLPGMLIHLS